MDAFSYLSVLLSIILGLAMTQVLQGYRGLMLHRGRVRLYAPPLIWSALMLLFATQSWWASFGLVDHRDWTFATFGILLLQTVLTYMMAAIVLPDVPADAGVDLRAHYHGEARPFFAIAIAMLGTSLLKDVMLDGRLPEASNVAFHAVFAGVSLVGIAARGPRTHLAIALAMTVFTTLYIGLLFARL